jgi:hypothetical protein
MTERPESIREALDDHDITLALTPGQLLLVVVGVWALVRFLRALRH